MWEKTFAACLYLLEIFFAIPYCVLCIRVKTSRDQGADLLQIRLPQGYSDNKILPAALKSFSIPFEKEKSDTVPGTKQNSNQPDQ